MSDENPYAPPAVEMTAPGIDWMNTDARGLSRTATGLSLVYFGIVVVLLSVVLSLAVVVFPPLVMVAMAGLFVGGIMMLVGPLLCLSVPEETGAKGLIVASVARQLVNLVLSGVSFLGIALPGAPSFSQLLNIVSAALLVLFMRKLALYIGQRKLADQARNVLVVAGASLVLAIIGFGMTLGLGPAAGLLMLVLGIMILISFVMYANLVNSLRKALKSSEIAG